MKDTKKLYGDGSGTDDAIEGVDVFVWLQFMELVVMIIMLLRLWCCRGQGRRLSSLK